MAHRSLTSAEVRATVGTRVRTRIAVAEVPEGVTGTMTSADRAIDGHDVEVAWGGTERRTPWVDWVTKAEDEARLEPAGPRAGPAHPRHGRRPAEGRAPRRSPSHLLRRLRDCRVKRWQPPSTDTPPAQSMA
jgi:hypothetical protein